MAAVRHLGFSKVQIFNGRAGQEGRNASACQILSKLVEIGRDMANFRFFKMAAAAILDFGNFKFLTVGTLESVELRLRAKFWRNRAKRG